jgi:hypothetical protein
MNPHQSKTLQSDADSQNLLESIKYTVSQLSLRNHYPHLRVTPSPISGSGKVYDSYADAVKGKESTGVSTSKGNCNAIADYASSVLPSSPTCSFDSMPPLMAPYDFISDDDSVPELEIPYVNSSSDDDGFPDLGHYHVATQSYKPVIRPRHKNTVSPTSMLSYVWKSDPCRDAFRDSAAKRPPSPMMQVD